jgi:hypothetical protein
MKPDMNYPLSKKNLISHGFYLGLGLPEPMPILSLTRAQPVFVFRSDFTGGE